MTRGADDPASFNVPTADEVAADEAAATIQEASFDSDLVEHMVRCWDAERENAERLARKVSTIISALTLLFGLGLFKIEWTMDPKHVSRVVFPCVIWLMKVSLSIALICFGRGLYLGIRGLRNRNWPRQRIQTASDQLRFPAELIKCPPLTERESRAAAFYRLSKAIDELSKQNAEKSARVQLCESWFLMGLALVLLATLAYILFSSPLK